MAIIKSFTNLHQSKKLVEILSNKGADMCYPRDAFATHYDKEPVCHYNGIGLAHPCWSLAALINILPTFTIDSSDDHYFRIHCYGKFTEWHDNLVDACYEMILKLNKLNLI